MSRKVRVLIAASEAVPYAKTGGLADVVGALAPELRRRGCEVAVMLPLYRGVLERFRPSPVKVRLSIPLDRHRLSGHVYETRGSGGVPVYFIGNDTLFDRPGLYGDRSGDYWDNSARFVFFSRAVLELARWLDFRPGIIHCHDWQTALIPLYVKTLYREVFSGVGSVFTIHNLGYQGQFWHWDMPLLGLGWEYFSMDALEFYGKINFMKAGVVFSDRITTVSPTYAREILTPEFGFGLDGVLQSREGDLRGILNGIDTKIWDPSRDRLIARTFGRGDLRGKAVCRTALRKECALAPEMGVPLMAFVGRMAGQKGVDEALEVASRLAAKKRAQCILLGSGDSSLERAALETASVHPGWIYARTAFDEAFSHRIYAGADIFLMPSRYEPCGLSQMMAMRYGSVVVARRTGGLADTVFEEGERANGFVYSSDHGETLASAVNRAITAFSNRRQWRGLVAAAMAGDYSWSSRAASYLDVYRELVDHAVGYVA